MIVPALPPEDMAWYVSIDDLVRLLTTSRREVVGQIMRWYKGPYHLRAAWTVPYVPFRPKLHLHLKDVLVASKKSGWVLSEDYYRQILDAKGLRDDTP